MLPSSSKGKSLHSETDKKKKSKKKRYGKKSSSESESTSDSEYERFRPRKKDQLKEKIDQNLMESAFSMAKPKEKKDRCEEEKNKCIIDKPGNSRRELNPYWKDGGSGLPKEAKHFSPLESAVGDGGLSWLKRSLTRAKETAREKGLPLEEVVRERWGSLEELESLIAEAEKRDPSRGRIRSERHFERPPRQQHFLKPSEETVSSPSMAHAAPRKNWMKKTDKMKGEFSNVEPVSKEDPCKKKKQPEKILSDSELNALAAKAVKAEILGNKALSEKLKSELEEAKKAKAAAESNYDKLAETILLTRTDSKGFTVPVDIGKSAGFSGSGKKKRKVQTHEPGGRVRYFPDDDKYSLKEMFEREKTVTAGDEEKAFFKSLGKGKSKIYDQEERFLDDARYEESEEKIVEREKSKSLRETKAKQKTLEGCKLCLENKNESKRLIVEIGSKCYLCLPEEESLTEGHCIIVPIHHTVCGTVADEDVWEEIQTFRKKLCDMFSQKEQDVIFFENARSLNKFPHMALHCVPLDKEQGDVAPIYFKKALLESETEWSNNKKVIDLKSKGLRNSVPKGLPYFAVDFGRESGFAHVIEDERLFPHNFAQEIIGGMLDLDHRIWRKHHKQDFNAQRDKFFKFIKMYTNFKRSENKDRSRTRTSSSSSSDTDTDSSG